MYSVFWASALVLLVLSVFSYQRLKHHQTSSNQVNHSYKVMFRLEEIFGSLREAESAQRAYLLTGDSVSLHRYYNYLSPLGDKVAALDSLVSSTPKQQQNLQEFTRLVKNRIHWLDVIIDSMHTLDMQELNMLLNKSRLASDSTQSQMYIMQELEDTLLNQRIRQKEINEARSATFIFLVTLFTLAVLLYSFFRLKKENNLRNKSEQWALVLEQKVRERTAELQALNRMLKFKNLELERRNEELRSFTYIACHDLKEPLRKIIMFSDRILHSDHHQLSDGSKIHFQRIMNATERMQNLIDAVFSYAKTEAGEEFAPVNLMHTAKQALETFQEVIEQKNAVIKIGNLPTIRAIPAQMEQLFTNLIGNALKYAKTTEPPVIEITADKQPMNRQGEEAGGPVWKIIFKDNGIGFDEAYKDKIFQIFQRLHTKTEYSGTGIGLAICKKIAENHHGNIMARSTINKGAEFILLLPENPIQYRKIPEEVPMVQS